MKKTDFFLFLSQVIIYTNLNIITYNKNYLLKANNTDDARHNVENIYKKRKTKKTKKKKILLYLIYYIIFSHQMI